MNTGEQLATASDPGERFEQSGYAVIKQFLPPLMCQYIAKNVRVLEKNSRFSFGDTQVEKAFSGGSPAIAETLLDLMTPVLSGVLGYELYPTYSYLRIYVKGAVLEKHTDRYSCEVSATIPIEFESQRNWPLCLEVGGNAKMIELGPGDALIYKGIQIPHWREPFEGERQVQVFLHYVKKDGQYSEYKFDQRPELVYHL
jgi:hypothetical protein